MMRPLAIFGALVVGVAMFFVAMEFAIGGWQAPYSCSLLLPFAWPLIMTVLTREEGDLGWAGAILLLVLIGADFALIQGCNGYCSLILAVSELPGVWYFFWGLLHLLAIATVVRWIVYRRDKRRAEG